MDNKNNSQLLIVLFVVFFTIFFQSESFSQLLFKMEDANNAFRILNTCEVKFLDVSPDGKMVAVYGRDLDNRDISSDEILEPGEGYYVFNTSTLNLLYVIKKVSLSANKDVFAIKVFFSADSKKLYIVTSENTFLIYSLPATDKIQYFNTPMKKVEIPSTTQSNEFACSSIFGPFRNGYCLLLRDYQGKEFNHLDVFQNYRSRLGSIYIPNLSNMPIHNNHFFRLDCIALDISVQDATIHRDYVFSDTYLDNLLKNVIDAIEKIIQMCNGIIEHETPIGTRDLSVNYNNAMSLSINSTIDVLTVSDDGQYALIRLNSKARLDAGTGTLCTYEYKYPSTDSDDPAYWDAKGVISMYDLCYQKGSSFVQLFPYGCVDLFNDDFYNNNYFSYGYYSREEESAPFCTLGWIDLDTGKFVNVYQPIDERRRITFPYDGYILSDDLLKTTSLRNEICFMDKTKDIVYLSDARSYDKLLDIRCYDYSTGFLKGILKFPFLPGEERVFFHDGNVLYGQKLKNEPLKIHKLSSSGFEDVKEFRIPENNRISFLMNGDNLYTIHDRRNKVIAVNKNFWQTPDNIFELTEKASVTRNIIKIQENIYQITLDIIPSSKLYDLFTIYESIPNGCEVIEISNGGINRGGCIEWPFELLIFRNQQITYQVQLIFDDLIFDGGVQYYDSKLNKWINFDIQGANKYEPLTKIRNWCIY